MSRRGKHAAPRSKGRVTRRFRRAAPLALAMVLLASAVAWADNLQAEGVDDLFSAGTIDFGEVCEGDQISTSVEIYAKAAGRGGPAPYSGQSIWPNGEVLDVTHTLSADLGAVVSVGFVPNNQIALPGDWQGSGNNAESGRVTSTIDFTAPAATGQGTITYSVTADNTATSGPSTHSSDTVVTVNWEVADCGVDYTFDGFYQPVGGNSDDDAAFFITAKAGQGIALKWNLYDADDEVVTDTSLYSARSSKFTCSLGNGEESVEDANTAGSSGFRYDADNEQSVYVWKTSKSWGGTCRTFELSYDGTVVATLDVHFTK